MRRIFTIISLLSAIYLTLLAISITTIKLDSLSELLWNKYAVVFFAVVGVISSIFSIKGNIRIGLIIINSALFILYVFILFVAIYGFREP